MAFRVEHLGFEMTFYHQDGPRLKLAEIAIEDYESQKEHAEIFIQHATSMTFSSVEILNWFLLQTQTSLDDHIPNPRPNLITFPIRFKPGMFHMHTEDGDQDLSHLKLLCKVIEVP